MTRDSKNEMQISEAELRIMTAEMVDMHEDTFPQLQASMLDLGSSLRSKGVALGKTVASRRGVVAGGTAAMGVLLLSACGSSDDKASDTPGTTPTKGGSDSGDAGALRLNASLENLAVFAYGAALEAAPMGKFGKVPPAVAEFATNAKKQHQDHADAFNAALKKAGGEAFTKPNPALTPTVLDLFKAVNSVPGLAMLALTLENTAAATYTKQMGELMSDEALAAVATIAPVERQHAAILSFVLGDYPIPDTFVKTTKTPTSLGARPNSDVPN